MIAIHQLRKRFGRQLALDDVSFEVPKGEIFGFVGPNGAGKTTTIRILATLAPADSGVATIGAPPTGEESGDWLEGVVTSKAWERRHERNLDRFSIGRCAAEYMRVTEELANIDSSLQVQGNQ